MAVVLETPTDLAVPPGVAFAYLADQRNEMSWNPRCHSVELLTGEPIGVGTRYRARWRGSPEMLLQVVEYEPSRRWVTRATSPAMTMVVSCGLTATPTGSRLTARMEITPHGLLRLARPLLKRGFAKGQVENGRLIARALGSGSDHRNVTS